MRLVVEHVFVRGWRVKIQLRIPLDEPPPPPDRGLSSKDRLRSLGVNGAYAYGRTAVSVHYDDGIAKVRTRRKSREQWLALMPGAHEGYVEWERAEAIRAMISNNALHGQARGAPKHGAALLAGILRCRRCGRKMTIQYSGTHGQIPRYSCKRGQLDYGEPSCIGFGGLRVDDVVEEAVVRVVQPGAVHAAVLAEEQAGSRRDEAREAMVRELEAARYTAERTFRQYDARGPGEPPGGR